MSRHPHLRRCGASALLRRPRDLLPHPARHALASVQGEPSCDTSPMRHARHRRRTPAPDRRTNPRRNRSVRAPSGPSNGPARAARLCCPTTWTRFSPRTARGPFQPGGRRGASAHNRSRLFISSPEVVERLRRVAPDCPRASPAARHHQGIRRQSGCRRAGACSARPAQSITAAAAEQHVALLIVDSPGCTLAMLIAPTYLALLRAFSNADLALLLFWYVANERTAALAAESIRRRRSSRCIFRRATSPQATAEPPPSDR